MATSGKEATPEPKQEIASKTNANDSICSAIILEGNNYKSQGNIFRDKIDTLRQNNDSVFEDFYILYCFPIYFLGIIGFIIFKILFLSNTIRLWPVIGKIYSEIYFGKTPARLGCKKRIVLKKRKTKGV